MSREVQVWSWRLALGVFALACRDASAVHGSDPLGSEAVALEAAERIERGRYLVSHVAACADCHSPRGADGHFVPERWLSGVDCFVDVMPEDPERGCISTRNWTAHETGLKNRSDREIKDMFSRGVRPDGKALHPFMPYAYFGNMRESDADAIVAYLRSVEAVDHTVTPSQVPFLAPEAPRPRVEQELIPQPSAGYPERAAALRGRYLAGEIGTCLDCHTPRDKSGKRFDRAFQGGLSFTRSELRLPPSYPAVIHSRNLTPDATGIAAYSIEDVVIALKHGVDREGERLCPPMPAGPFEAFGGLTDADATDIAHYLASLAPGEHAIPDNCRVPASERGGKAIE